MFTSLGILQSWRFIATKYAGIILWICLVFLSGHSILLKMKIRSAKAATLALIAYMGVIVAAVLGPLWAAVALGLAYLLALRAVVMEKGPRAFVRFIGKVAALFGACILTFWTTGLGVELAFSLLSFEGIAQGGGGTGPAGWLGALFFLR